MASQRSKKPRFRSLAPAVVLCGAFLVWAAPSSSASADPTSTLDLCIRLAGPEKGDMRFVADERCRRSERLVRGIEGREAGSTDAEAGEGAMGLIAGTSGLQPSRTGTTYMGPFLTWHSSGVEAQAQQPLPVGGVVSNLLVKIANPPGNGGSWTYTIRKDGDGQSGALRCTIAGSEGPASRSCSSHGTIRFAPGDLLSLEVDPGDGAGQLRKSGPIRWGVTLQPS